MKIFSAEIAKRLAYTGESVAGKLSVFLDFSGFLFFEVLEFPTPPQNFPEPN
jgi:hypothetical protein